MPRDRRGSTEPGEAAEDGEVNVDPASGLGDRGAGRGLFETEVLLLGLPISLRGSWRDSPLEKLGRFGVTGE